MDMEAGSAPPSPVKKESTFAAEAREEKNRVAAQALHLTAQKVAIGIHDQTNQEALGILVEGVNGAGQSFATLFSLAANLLGNLLGTVAKDEEVGYLAAANHMAIDVAAQARAARAARDPAVIRADLAASPAVGSA